MNDKITPPAQAPASPARQYETPGYALAMRVMQSDLYPVLDGKERAECDELIRIGQAPAAPSVGEPVAKVLSWTAGSYWRNYKLEWINDVPEGTLLYATPPAAPAATEAPSDAVLDAVDSLIGQIKHIADGTEGGVWRDLLARCATVTAAIENTSVAKVLGASAQPVPESLSDEQINRAAKVLAGCMDYPWEHMPEKGRATMRKHAESVVRAASEVKP